MRPGRGFNKAASILLMLTKSSSFGLQPAICGLFRVYTSQKKTPDLSLRLMLRLQIERSAVIHARCSSHGPA